MKFECRKRVFCNHCRSYNHDTKACRKQEDNTLSPTHSQIVTGYCPTATPPPLMGTTAATQPTEMHNNPLFNVLDNNPPRTSTLMHTPQNGMSPALTVSWWFFRNPSPLSRYGQTGRYPPALVPRRVWRRWTRGGYPIVRVLLVVCKLTTLHLGRDDRGKENTVSPP